MLLACDDAPCGPRAGRRDRTDAASLLPAAPPSTRCFRLEPATATTQQQISFRTTALTGRNEYSTTCSDVGSTRQQPEEGSALRRLRQRLAQLLQCRFELVDAIKRHRTDNGRCGVGVDKCTASHRPATIRWRRPLATPSVEWAQRRRIPGHTTRGYERRSATMPCSTPIQVGCERSPTPSRAPTPPAARIRRVHATRTTRTQPARIFKRSSNESAQTKESVEDRRRQRTSASLTMKPKAVAYC
jgi:hypothetical protein